MATLLLCIVCIRIYRCQKRPSIREYEIWCTGNRTESQIESLTPLLFGTGHISSWRRERVYEDPTYLRVKNLKEKLNHLHAINCNHTLPDPMDCPQKGLNKHFQLLPITLLLQATLLLTYLKIMARTCIKSHHRISYSTALRWWTTWSPRVNRRTKRVLQVLRLTIQKFTADAFEENRIGDTRR